LGNTKSFLKITETLGIRSLPYVGSELVARMRSMWEKRNETKCARGSTAR
jgi:hypothetical protein